MDITQTPAAGIIFFVTIGISLYAMYGNRSLYNKMILSPMKVVHQNQWYLLITSGFIHADLMHLFFNMISFYFFAFQLENKIGTENFLIIYFGALILSDISTVIKNKDNPNYRSLGASGAISAVIYSMIMFAPTQLIYVYFIPMPAILFAVLFLLYGYWASKKSGDFINHSAHNWGAVVGVVLTIILVPQSLKIFISQLF